MTESTVSTRWAVFFPFLGFQIVKAVSPQLPHQLLFINTKLSAVHLGKLLESESPSMQPRSKSNSTGGWTDLSIQEWCRISLKFNKNTKDDIFKHSSMKMKLTERNVWSEPSNKHVCEKLQIIFVKPLMLPPVLLLSIRALILLKNDVTALFFYVRCT